AVITHRDALVVMPTGGGKSLCYQLPAAQLPGVALVISPLISLMKDQVDRLKRLDITAIALNSTTPPTHIRGILEYAMSGNLKVLFVSPERLESEQFRETLPHLPLSFIAIDEAHIISEWGNEFRPSY